MKLLNHSIVVVAQAHNPSILNPDFLARTNIVPASWDWKVGEPVLSTPPLAQVPYTNGVTLVCDPSKLQVIDAGQTLDPPTSKVCQIAEAYVRTLPHVPYTAAGINFSAAIAHRDPDQMLRERFLKTGPWDEEPDRVKAIGLRLVYPMEGGQLRVSLDSGEIEDMSSGTTHRLRVVIVAANFHHDRGESDRVESLVAFLSGVADYWAKFVAMTRKLVAED